MARDEENENTGSRSFPARAGVAGRRWRRWSCLTQITLSLLAASTFPALAHDWYKGKTNPKTNVSCCGVQDCFELTEDQWRQNGDGSYSYFHVIQDKWLTIPGDQALPSRNGKAHGCAWNTPFKAEPHKCFFAPLGF